MLLRDYLPSVYHTWLTRAEWNQPLVESHATCDNCIQARGARAIYKDSLKCCTFFPFLTNFTVGALLSSDLPGGKWLRALLTNTALIERASQAQTIVTPLGILPSIDYQRFFKSQQPDGYGNNPHLLCPYYVSGSGNCGIWKFRPSPCVSFYCESSRGMKGIEFWSAFEKWLSFFELALAREALIRQGMTDDEIKLSEKFLPRYGDPDRHASTGTKMRTEEARSWFEFGKDKVEFYSRCYKLVMTFQKDEIDFILGSEGKALEDEAFKRLSG